MKKTIAQTRQQAMIVAFLSIVCFQARSQSLEQVLATNANANTPERAYLHYDKSVYAAGETVWFKAYLMEDILPAQGRRTLYVDWVDEKGAVLAHVVSPIVDGTANNQFDIPANYSGNFIHVRAYTKWMLNFDSAFLYDKAIRVVSNSKSSSLSKPVGAQQVQFFPEGGEGIIGIKNKIAFLAADQWGRPVSVSGVVKNNAGAIVAVFASQHDGMGAFYLAPQRGASYTAQWKDVMGGTHTTPLPEAKPIGVTLELTLQDTKRRFTLTRTADAPELLQQLHLIGTMNGNFVFQTAVDLSTTNTFSGLIPTKALPTGILTVTVFDGTWNAVAERITFVKNNDYPFVPKVDIEHRDVNKRGRNEIKITVPDSLEANLSVAVTDNALPTDSSDNIVSHLLLSSQIKGYVLNPAYYFENNSDSVNENLDLVMLTHGWRRFKWEDVVKGRLPAITYPKDTTYLSLSGQVYGAHLKKVRGSIVLFVNKDSNSSTLLEPVAPDGTFYVPNSVFYDTIHVYYQLQPAQLFNRAYVRFMPNRLLPLHYIPALLPVTDFASGRDTTGDYRLQLLAQARAQASELMREKMLAKVTVHARIKTTKDLLDEKYTSGFFGGGIDSYQFDLLHDPLAGAQHNIFDYLQGKVAGLIINPSFGGGGASVQWHGANTVIFLDENNITSNPDLLSSVSVSDIAYVKVFPPPFMFAPSASGSIYAAPLPPSSTRPFSSAVTTSGGANGAGGAIAIYTRKGDDVPDYMAKKGLNNNTVVGYTPAREFYAPNYDRVNARNDEVNLNTTLYWNPAVLTTPKKNAITVTFYNNDITKAFRVIIEGMTKDGRLAHVEQVIE